jgi:ISXO2-like transposase domain
LILIRGRCASGSRRTEPTSAAPGRANQAANGGKTVVAGAIESGRGKMRGRRLGRLRLAALPDASRANLEGFLAANVTRTAGVTTDGWAGYGGQNTKPGCPSPSSCRRANAWSLALRHVGWLRRHPLERPFAGRENASPLK